MAEVLEYPQDEAFAGRVGRTMDDSVQAYPSPARAPEGAPNVVFVVLDDVGYAQLGCFGSDIATPALDRLAAGGLRYRNFHTTAMCSPTRASLLSGCNHHTTGMGGIADQGTGFPGYNAQITKKTGFLSEILRDNGYATFALGKWHLAPREETSLGSPRGRWPLGRGFERFYGFMGAETNQYAPDLVHDNHIVEPPAAATPDGSGYHLTEDLADRTIEWINDVRNAEPDRPFFAYFCPGALHVPHHAPPEWIDRYAGRFDVGWDVWRERTYRRQLGMGVIPKDTTLTPRPDWIDPWDELPTDQRRLYAKAMEVFAGFLSHTDHQIGRIVEHLERIGELDDTIFVAISDNGASPEGGPHGSFNSNLYYNGEPETLEVSAPHLEAWGDPSTYPAYPYAWAHAGNAPFQRWKRETHEGGIADPLIVHYPRGIRSKGEIRTQYAHVIDVMPTVLDLIGIERPHTVDGVPQVPMAGTSLVPTLDGRDAAEVRVRQYYEMLGSRGIYDDGWKAVAWHPFIGQNYDTTVDSLRGFDDDPWELYHVADDFSESTNLAAREPERLRHLIELWWAEADRYEVLPLHSMRAIVANRPRLSAPRDRHVYRPGGPVPTTMVVDVRNRSHAISADVTIPSDADVAAGDADGVLVAHGGRFGGYAFYVHGGRLHYHYNLHTLDRTTVTSDRLVPRGDTTLSLSFDTPGGGHAPADITLFIDGETAGSGTVPRITLHTFTLMGDGFCVGHDDSTPVTDDYSAPFRFAGELHSVTLSATGEAYDISGEEWEASRRSE